MSKIISLSALEILDSRGNPTLQVTVHTDQNILASAAVPSGASTGSNEALELRDKDPKRFHGKGVQKAIRNVLGPISKALIGHCVCDQRLIDHLMIEADGTENKSKLGANAILGVSMAVVRVGSPNNTNASLPLFRRYKRSRSLPYTQYTVASMLITHSMPKSFSFAQQGLSLFQRPSAGAPKFSIL